MKKLTKQDYKEIQHAKALHGDLYLIDLYIQYFILILVALDIEVTIATKETSIRVENLYEMSQEIDTLHLIVDNNIQHNTKWYIRFNKFSHYNYIIMYLLQEPTLMRKIHKYLNTNNTGKKLMTYEEQYKLAQFISHEYHKIIDKIK